MQPSAMPFAPPPPMAQPFGNLPPAPALNFGNGPPPGRPGGLPRPGGYLDPSYGANLHMPPAPPQYDPGSGFGGGGFPETVDFGRNSAPVIVRRSGPPGLVVLLTLIAGAVGGVWLGEKVTHNAMATLEAAQAAKAETPRAPSSSLPSSSQQRK